MTAPIPTPPSAELRIESIPDHAARSNQRVHLRALLTVSGDVFAILAGLACTHWLLAQIHPEGNFSVSDRILQIDWALSLAVLICALCLRLHYKNHYTEHPAPWDQLRDICYTTTALMVVHGFFFFLMKEDFSRSMTVLGWVLSIPILLMFRVGVRKLCETRGIWKIPALMVYAPDGGTTEASLSRLKENLPGYQWATLPSNAVTPPDITNVAMVFFLSDEVGKLQTDFPTVLDLCSFHGKKTGCIMTDLDMSQFNAEIRTSYFDSPSMLQIRSNLTIPWKKTCKRSLDIALAASGLIVAAPVILIFSLLTRVDGGPAFYSHRRVGKHGVEFNCHKIRSMHVDAASTLQELLKENADTRKEWDAFQKLTNDPRVTPLGRFIRRTCIDELPQLYDVLIGKMSLVGPRPITLDEMDRYGHSKMRYLSVRPGITGIWQCSQEDRNAFDYEQRVGMDTWYINNWSVWLDIMILLKTIPTVIKSRVPH